MVLERGDGAVYDVLFEHEADPGIAFEPMHFGCCGNHCIFCFIDQNPRGLRKTLYFKDEDYRLSFLHGNYVTLTRTGRADLARIAAQRLSPLYISVHAADPAVRTKMLGLSSDDHLMDKIRFLADSRIELHAQIVLCPGINDGRVLAETHDALRAFYPQMKSLAVVPVGLTRHRKGLPDLRAVDAGTARQVIGGIHALQERNIKELGGSFVFLADEFYLLAGAPLPPAARYGEFWQIENGVGMTRAFLDDFEREAADLPKRLKRRKKIVIVTGALAAPVLEGRVIPRLRQIGGLEADLALVENRFYGTSVTVSGLLTGQDIARALAGRTAGATVLLPANCLNTDGLFLDDWTPERLSAGLGCRVVVAEGFGAGFEGLMRRR